LIGKEKEKKIKNKERFTFQDIIGLKLKERE